LDQSCEDATAHGSKVPGLIDLAVSNGNPLNLMYHGVHPPRQERKGGAWVQSAYEVSPAVLRAHLAYLVSSGIGYRPLAPAISK
jgi:hypothetical protein